MSVRNLPATFFFNNNNRKGGDRNRSRKNNRDRVRKAFSGKRRSMRATEILSDNRARNDRKMDCKLMQKSREEKYGYCNIDTKSTATSTCHTRKTTSAALKHQRACACKKPQVKIQSWTAKTPMYEEIGEKQWPMTIEEYDAIMEVGYSHTVMIYKNDGKSFIITKVEPEEASAINAANMSAYTTAAYRNSENMSASATKEGSTNLAASTIAEAAKEGSANVAASTIAEAAKAEAAITNARSWAQIAMSKRVDAPRLPNNFVYFAPIVVNEVHEEFKDDEDRWGHKKVVGKVVDKNGHPYVHNDDVVPGRPYDECTMNEPPCSYIINGKKYANKEVLGKTTIYYGRNKRQDNERIPCPRRPSDEWIIKILLDPWWYVKRGRVLANYGHGWEEVYCEPLSDMSTWVDDDEFENNPLKYYRILGDLDNARGIRIVDERYDPDAPFINPSLLDNRHWQGNPFDPESCDGADWHTNVGFPRDRCPMRGCGAKECTC